jgi:hypothetical protein
VDVGDRVLADRPVLVAELEIGDVDGLGDVLGALGAGAVEGRGCERHPGDDVEMTVTGQSDVSANSGCGLVLARPSRERLVHGVMVTDQSLSQSYGQNAHHISSVTVGVRFDVRFDCDRSNEMPQIW